MNTLHDFSYSQLLKIFEKKKHCRRNHLVQVCILNPFLSLLSPVLHNTFYCKLSKIGITDQCMKALCSNPTLKPRAKASKLLVQISSRLLHRSFDALDRLKKTADKLI